MLCCVGMHCCVLFYVVLCGSVVFYFDVLCCDVLCIFYGRGVFHLALFYCVVICCVVIVFVSCT